MHFFPTFIWSSASWNNNKDKKHARDKVFAKNRMRLSLLREASAPSEIAGDTMYIPPTAFNQCYSYFYTDVILLSHCSQK
jgi:hypothetical protein